jgi:transcriptional regulator with PAS, ATPase and Fis domain
MDMTSTAAKIGYQGVAARGEAEGFAPCGAAMSRVMRMADKVAPTTISVLVLGECGVGKDVLARRLHQRSRRADKPFLAINCGALPETLIASELFGYESGAFTGAARTGKMGLLESADGGTVFLDEIGDMPLSTQATLLRVLESGELRPIMSLRPRHVDVRFIAATNKDLEEAVARKEFRRDLLHRLNTLTLAVPPLRDRVEEIPHLAQEFVEATWRKIGRPGSPRLGTEVLAWLSMQRWPGNVRELKNLMDCAAALSEGPEIGLEDLPTCDWQPAARQPTSEVCALVTDPVSQPEAIDGDDRRRVLAALAACNGNQSRAAALLGVSRRTFIAKLEQYRIPRPQKRYPVPFAGVPRLGQTLDGRGATFRRVPPMAAVAANASAP